MRRQLIIAVGLILGLAAPFTALALETCDGISATGGIKNCGAKYRDMVDRRSVNCVSINLAGCQSGEICQTLRTTKGELTGARCAKAGSDPTVTVKGGPITFIPNISIPGLFTGGEVTGRTAGEYVAAVYVYFVGIVGVLAVVMIMYAGLMWITAAGDTGKITQAKEQMNGAIIGLILTLTSYLLLQLINPDLVKLQSLSLPVVPRLALDFEELSGSEKGAPPVPFELGKAADAGSFDGFLLAAANNNRELAFKLKAIMMIESRGNASVNPSSKGAIGLMQLMPGSFPSYSLDQLKDPETNIKIAADYIQKIFNNTCPATARTTNKDKYGNYQYADCDEQWAKAGSKSCVDGNWTYVVAAYNGGTGANCASKDCPGKTWWECPSNWHGPGSYEDTKDYVAAFDAWLKLIKDNNWLKGS